MSYPDLASIHATAERAKAEGIPLPEKAIRRAVKSGSLRAVYTGRRALIYFPNVVDFVRDGNNQPERPEPTGTIRMLRA